MTAEAFDTSHTWGSARVSRALCGVPPQSVHRTELASESESDDPANNCRRLWPIIFGREIDPRAEIIAPALQKRREGYGEPTRDYKQELRDAVREYGL